MEPGELRAVDKHEVDGSQEDDDSHDDGGDEVDDSSQDSDDGSNGTEHQNKPGTGNGAKPGLRRIVLPDDGPPPRMHRAFSEHVVTRWYRCGDVCVCVCVCV